MEKKEEIREPLNVKMEKREGQTEDSTLHLYNKIVKEKEKQEEEKIFQSFKKMSMEEVEENAELDAMTLGTKKPSLTADEEDKNVFDINDYLNYYGVKKNDSKTEESQKVEEIPKVESEKKVLEQPEPVPESEPQSQPQPEPEIIETIEEPKIEIAMKDNQVIMNKVNEPEEKPIELEPKNSLETEEKKESVYDYFGAEKFEGLASSGDFESEGEPLEIIPEDPEKWEQFKNSYVEEVNFDDAPSVTLYKGPIDYLYDTLGMRLRKKYDARKELKKKKKTEKLKKIEEHNNRELMKDIRETNVIKRTIVSQDEGSKTNIFLDDPKQTKKNEFNISQDRINKELLSQAPGEMNQIKARGFSPDNNLNSNFTHGNKSKENTSSGQNKNNHYASEVVMDPFTNEVSLKRQTNKKVISHEEYKKIMIAKESNKIVKTNVLSNQNKVQTMQAKPGPKLYNAKTNSIGMTQKTTTKYLKLVVDANGNKKYEMVSVNNSPQGSMTEIKSTRRSENNPSLHTQNYKSPLQPTSTTHSPLIKNTPVRTYTHSPLPSITHQNPSNNITSFTNRQIGQNQTHYPPKQTYTVYRNSQNNLNSQNTGDGGMSQGTRVEAPKYQTYAYSGENRRFQTGGPVQGSGQGGVIYHRSPSPYGVEKRARKSSKKVTVYRNGVKVSEKIVYDE